MKLVRILAAIAIGTATAGAFAATSSTDQATDQTQTATASHNWYQAGDRALQSDRQSNALPGFPRAGEVASDY